MRNLRNQKFVFKSNMPCLAVGEQIYHEQVVMGSVHQVVGSRIG